MFASRVLGLAVKRTTGIVGLEVVPNAREVLVGLYQKTMQEIQVAHQAPPTARAEGFAAEGDWS